MNWWIERVVPRLTDAPLSQPPVMKLRREICQDLHGDVLEIGFGSGLNTRYYPNAVKSLDAVEPSDLGWERSEGRRSRSAVPVQRVGLDGQALAAEDASYDAVLCTFSLCTIPDAAAAVREARRVLRPGGTFHFLEHAASPAPGVRRWQGRLEPMQRALFGGCHLTRNPEDLLRDAGFSLGTVEHMYLAPGPMKPWGYLSWGVAAAP